MFKTVLVFSFLAKGLCLLPFFAVDDYAILFDSGDIFWLFESQGRFLLIYLYKFFDLINVNPVAISFSTSFFSIFFHVVFIISVIRLFKFQNFKFRLICALLIALHPYTSEILTFKMSGIITTFMFFIMTIIVEIIIQKANSLKYNIIVVVLMFFSYSVYQLSLNYFLVIFLMLLFSGILKSKINLGTELKSNPEIQLASRMFYLTFISVSIYIIFFKVFLLIFKIEAAGRSNFINVDQFGARILEIKEAFVSIFFSADSLIPFFIKLVLLIGLAIALILLYVQNNYQKNQTFLILCFISLVLIIPFLSLGLIIIFQDWWPVPRVISHISLILGLFFLIFFKTKDTNLISVFLNRFISVALTVVIIAFIFINNQIFFDQFLINKWDASLANRIMSKIEQHEKFSELQSVYIHGGNWGYPTKLRTLNGDLNISALYRHYSNVNLLTSTTGYFFQKVNGEEINFIKEKCKDMEIWPKDGSIDIINGICIVCLSD